MTATTAPSGPSRRTTSTARTTCPCAGRGANRRDHARLCQPLDRRTINVTAGQVAPSGRRGAPIRAGGRRRSLGQRRCARAHELWRPVPDHPRTCLGQMAAEDLDIVHALIVNKEQRSRTSPTVLTADRPASLPERIVVHGQEFHTRSGGTSEFSVSPAGTLLPGYAAIRIPRPRASRRPMRRRRHGACAGRAGRLRASLRRGPASVRCQGAAEQRAAVDVALGKVDYIEIGGFSDHSRTAAGLVPAAEPGIPPAGGERHRRDDELSPRCAARSAVTASIRARRRRPPNDRPNGSAR